MEKISKEHLSLAGEYAVASELCKRGMYAQLTLGTRKKTDILVHTGKTMLEIQVKAKQGRCWPLIKGIWGDNILLIFVDYQNKKLEERPDFYILTSSDWENLVKSSWVGEDSSGKWTLDDNNCPVKISNEGKTQWKGWDIGPKDIIEHREKWGKIEAL